MFLIVLYRHCEEAEPTTQSIKTRDSLSMDCFVTSLLAMTGRGMTEGSPNYDNRSNTLT